MIHEFARVSPGIELQAWVNVLPPGTVHMEENGVDFTGYAAKPWALEYALDSGADVALLLDAAFYPIRSIHPLLDYIAQTGYYLCDNGNMLGDWCSDRFVGLTGQPRSTLREIREVSSYAVGFNRHHGGAMEVVQRWTWGATDKKTICGPHTAEGFDGRNVGFVSSDPTVRGHRHDQSALSILAHSAGLTELCQRPRFTAYLGSETAETVLVNQGM